MPARGRTSFNKRQKEQQRKERNQEKLARRQSRKDQQPALSIGLDNPNIVDNLLVSAQSTVASLGIRWDFMNDQKTYCAPLDARVILCLEDDDPTAFLFERAVLEHDSTVHVYRVFDCSSAMAFLSQITPFVGVPRPHVVVLDLNVPGDSGFSVLRAIRSDPALAQLPVMIFTSSTATSDQDEARENRADGYLVKSGYFSAFTSAAELALRLAA